MPLPNDGEIVCGGCKTGLTRSEIVCWRCGYKMGKVTPIEDNYKLFGKLPLDGYSSNMFPSITTTKGLDALKQQALDRYNASRPNTTQSSGPIAVPIGINIIHQAVYANYTWVVNDLNSERLWYVKIGNPPQNFLTGKQYLAMGSPIVNLHTAAGLYFQTSLGYFRLTGDSPGNFIIQPIP